MSFLSDLIGEIWASYRKLPFWVQCWVFPVLVSTNLASVFFIAEPQGLLIAILAVAGMAPNLFILIAQRDFPKSMAVSHLIFWIPLLFVLWPYIGEFGYARVLFAVNAISLLFDLNDTKEWWQARARVR